ncbi:MAG: DUF3788 family protein [Desulfobacteraceae bacterium]|nr:MAG: DUF3788 family protein [Desulfobacteraceae bacterium]
MKSSVFREKENCPNKKELLRVLGKTFKYFLEMSGFHAGYMHEWHFYGKNFGWQFKTADSKKALFYLSPLQDSFLVTLGVREKEKNVLLSSKLPEIILKEIESAKKHPEGYAVYLMVTDTASFKTAKMLIKLMLEIRSKN